MSVKWGFLFSALIAGIASCRGSSGLDDGAAPASGGSFVVHTGGASNAGAPSLVGGFGGISFTPSYHPPSGFEGCIHAKVEERCKGGWCTLPSSCFVMGSPEEEWRRGQNTEQQVAVVLTRSFEMQQTEMTRQFWTELVGTDTQADTQFACDESDCPITNMTWWDAIYAANLLSERAGLAKCYRPLGCEGTPGNGMICTGVEDPDSPIQACAGYRLPTRAEMEYATRAGTISSFYSGEISPQADTDCRPDLQLDLIAWYCSNSETRSHKVHVKPPNGFGLTDLLGNVGEMLNDERTSRTSPGGEDPEGTVGTSSNRTIYGCDVRAHSSMCRAASRLTWPWDGRSWFTGFRLVRTLDP